MNTLVLLVDDDDLTEAQENEQAKNAAAMNYLTFWHWRTMSSEFRVVGRLVGRLVGRFVVGLCPLGGSIP